DGQGGRLAVAVADRGVVVDVPPGGPADRRLGGEHRDAHSAGRSTVRARVRLARLVRGQGDHGAGALELGAGGDEGQVGAVDDRGRGRQADAREADGDDVDVAARGVAARGVHVQRRRVGDLAGEGSADAGLVVRLGRELGDGDGAAVDRVVRGGGQVRRLGADGDPAELLVDAAGRADRGAGPGTRGHIRFCAGQAEGDAAGGDDLG